MNSCDIKLGDTVRDTVTGVTGILMSLHYYIDGTTAVDIQPPADENGKVPESLWTELTQLALIESNTIPAIPIQWDEVHIELGQRVRDMVSGFEGIAVTRNEYLNGCVQFAVEQPFNTQTATLPRISFSHKRLHILENALTLPIEKRLQQKTPGKRSMPSGGPQDGAQDARR